MKKPTGGFDNGLGAILIGEHSLPSFLSRKSPEGISGLFQQHRLRATICCEISLQRSICSMQLFRKGSSLGMPRRTSGYKDDLLSTSFNYTDVGGFDDATPPLSLIGDKLCHVGNCTAVGLRSLL